MRLVLDTNVVISGFLNPHGAPGRILAQARGRTLTLCFSASTLRELIEVLNRPKIRRLARVTALDWENLQHELAASCELVALPLTIEAVIPEDPDDDHVLATAVSADAECIVSGDRHLQKLAYHHGIPILSPSQFLQLPGRESS